uniref:Uncharacterized protein n=1 Tax=Physcomitrium patens TaxID=3218 RepID=A0A2K1IMJ9_PHYPA|nr:hypothetical protein PHYPA_026821 [Physcomitrium patens]
MQPLQAACAGESGSLCSACLECCRSFSPSSSFLLLLHLLQTKHHNSNNIIIQLYSTLLVSFWTHITCCTHLHTGTLHSTITKTSPRGSLLQIASPCCVVLPCGLFSYAVDKLLDIA